MQTFLENLSISSFNKIQQAYLADKNKNTLLLSNTGSGKTIAFVAKLYQLLQEVPLKKSVLILSPTRELALQIHQVIQKARLPYSNIVCYGGHSFKNEVLQFAQKPQIIIGTPGRILDHFQRDTLGISTFSHLIVDEYDKTLEFGFLNELTQIYEFADNMLDSIQLVSATKIEKLPSFLEKVSFSTCDFLEENKPKIDFYKVKASENDKLKALALLLTTFQDQTTLVFCTHREACDRLHEHLDQYGKSSAVFHGGLEQGDRQLALFKFKSKSVDCLICSDLAARGLDISEINNIVHYQYPHTLEDFTHRNGRTARVAQSGKVYLIHSENEPLPEYSNSIEFSAFSLPENFEDYEETKFSTVFFNIGRKHKIRKVDIIGYLTKEMNLDFKEIGTLEVFDNYAYVALSKNVLDNNSKILNHPHKLKKNNFKIRYAR